MERAGNLLPLLEGPAAREYQALRAEQETKLQERFLLPLTDKEYVELRGLLIGYRQAGELIRAACGLGARAELELQRRATLAADRPRAARRGGVAVGMN
jgi:hypothetical protein